MSEGSGYIPQVLQGIDGVEIRISEDEKTGRDGGNIWNLLESMRIIAIEGVVIGTDVADFFTKRRALTAAFSINNNNDLELTTWDGTTRNYKAKVVVPPMIVYSAEDGNVCYGNFRIELKCEESFVRDENSITDSTGLSSGGGFTIPFALPLSWTASTPDTLTIDNTGDYADYAKFTISGPVLNPKVISLTTGESFQFDVELFAGETIELYYDTTGFWVYKNGTILYYSEFKGTFFKFPVGTNTIKFGASRYDATALLTAEFINKYRSH